MRASSTQKAYDEAFLACSTAVYFESQSNESEALRQWKSALDQIYYHNAHRPPSGLRLAPETDKALAESLHQLELQCKERVHLLETLKQSQDEANENLGSTKRDHNAPAPPPHRTPLVSAEVDGSPNWLRSGTTPPVEYPDLSRPSLAPRKSSVASTHTINKATSASGPMLSPVPTARKVSRTPSPEKKGRFLKTLRPGRESKSSASILASSMRSRPPEAAKAATQAWGFRLVSGSSRASKPLLKNPTGRSSSERPSSTIGLEKPATQALDQGPCVPQAALYTNPPVDCGSEPELAVKPRTRLDISALPNQCTSFDAGRLRSSHSSSAVLPSYRNEYPEPVQNARVLAASAAVRSWTDLESGKTLLSPPSTSHRQLSFSNSYPRSPQREKPKSISLEAGDVESKAQPLPRRKSKAKDHTVRAKLPATPASEANDSENSEEESDEWKERMRWILKNLPRGVDETAAQQILNDIVIQGDEVHWEDVAGLDIAKSALKETVVYPFLRPDLFMGLREPARGMLLFGPPGTGKTMLARAVATESRSTFFAISASSLTSKFLGESEKLVRALFALAKLLAPSIIFVDEIDSLLSSRSSSGEQEATRRIKTEFLIQWSDLARAAAGRDRTDKDKEKGDASRVLVLAATNLPWSIDEAARRRFVRRQYIPLPEDRVRKCQVTTLLSHQKHELGEADLDWLVQLTEGFSGSDITALAKDAAMGPLRSLGEDLLHTTMDKIRPIQFRDFEASLQTIRPSVSKQGLRQYEEWAAEFGERGG